MSRSSWLLAGGLALLLVPAAIRLADGVYDDAYIHLRIARHLVELGRPEFNAGEPVYASSSTAWTLVLAGWIAIGGGSAAGMAALSAAFTALAAGVWASFVREHVDGPAPIVAGVVVAALLFDSAAGGMEAPLALLLLGLGALGWARDRRWAGAALAAAVATRIELGVFLALFLLDRRRPADLRWAAAVLGPIVLLELGWYGTLVPHTMIAKRAVYQLDVLHALSVAGLGMPWPGPPSVWVLADAALALVLLAVALWWRPAEVSGRLLFGAALLAAVYLWSGQYIHPWYWPNVDVPAAAAVVVVLARERQRVLTALAGLAALPSVVSLVLRLATAAVDPAADGDVRAADHVRDGLAVGAWASERYPGGVLLTSEIGTLGVAYDGKVADGIGLVSPDALPFHPLRVPDERPDGATGAIPPAYVAQLRPDLVVGRPYLLAAFERSPVAADYQRVPRDGPLAVWVRVPDR